MASLFAPYKRRVAVVFALITLASGISIAQPFLLRRIFDTAFPERRLGLLTVLASAMVALTMVSTAATMLHSYLTLSVGQKVVDDLRTSVFRHLQHMSLGFFTRTRTGEVQSRISNDIGGMNATMTTVATTVMSSLTTMIASLIAMFILDWRLACVSLTVLSVFVWITRRVGVQRRAISRERQRQMAVMSTMVEESLSVDGFLLGRTMGQTNALTSDFARESSSLTDLVIRSTMAGRWRQSLLQIIMASAPIAIYWVGGYTVDRGRSAVSLGTLIAFTTLQQALLAPSVQLLQAGTLAQSSLSLFERIFEYLDLPIEVREPLFPIPRPVRRGHVRFEKVSFRYGNQWALRDIDLDIPPGGHLAVVGATGAGKTTLGYLVPRLYDVTAGRVRIDGIDVRDLSFATLTAAVGVVSQNTHLFHATIAENLRFAKPDATDAELIAAARAARVHDLIMRLPYEYQTVVGERGHRFSGGEKQRLAIARAILRNPPILVLDEATSALDTATEQSVQQALDALFQGRTTITIAHRLSTIRDADQIVVLDGGRIVERGTHDELMARAGRYANLVDKSGGTEKSYEKFKEDLKSS